VRGRDGGGAGGGRSVVSDVAAASVAGVAGGGDAVEGGVVRPRLRTATSAGEGMTARRGRPPRTRSAVFDGAAGRRRSVRTGSVAAATPSVRRRTTLRRRPSLRSPAAREPVGAHTSASSATAAPTERSPRPDCSSPRADCSRCRRPPSRSLFRRGPSGRRRAVRLAARRWARSPASCASPSADGCRTRPVPPPSPAAGGRQGA